MRIIGGIFKHRTLISPKGEQTRPTSERLRETIFNIIQGHIEEKTFLDLYAGSGAVGIEAISRGASFVTMIEKDRKALQALQENIKKLEILDQTKILCGDVLTLLKRLKGESYDIIFIDPPYEKGFQEKTLELIDLFHLLAKEGIIFVEESAQYDHAFPKFLTFQFRKKRKVGSSFLYEFTSLL
jgi:16S rRNA (guanine(966)-N(2))-methyltransferase RsmD